MNKALLAPSGWGNKIGKHTQENIFLIKIPKILRVFALDCALWYESVRFIETSTCQRLVSVGNLNLSNDQSNACVAGTTRSVNANCSDVITVPLFLDCSQSSIFPSDLRDRALCVTGCHLAWVSKLLRGRGRFERAIIPDAHPLGTFENQDTRDGKTRYI